MRITDVMWLGYKELSGKKVRTILTTFMVVIGIAAIVALTSQTAGISVAIQKQLSTLGPTSIILTSTKGTGFTAIDMANLQSLPNVSAVIPIIKGSGSVIANGQNTSVTVIGISSNSLPDFTGGAQLYQGAMYQDMLSPSSVIGYDVAFPTSLGGKQNVQVGQPITLTLDNRASNGASSITIPVSGIMEKASGTAFTSVDSAVIMSLQEAGALLHRSSYNIIVVRATNTSTVTPLSNLISDIYGSNADVLTTQQLLQATSSILGSITLLLGVIGGISLLVAAVGIMNVMLISVYEKTHEIGIMKSLGFKSRHVLMIFVFQAFIIGMVGGMIGIALGAGASYTLSSVLGHAGSSSGSPATSIGTHTPARGAGARFQVGAGGGSSPAGASSGPTSLSYSPAFKPGMLVEALIIAIVVAMLAGMYPAWRASKMEPIDALREL